jgi:HEPN domain-containing protein
MSDQAPELVQDWLQRAHSSLKLGRAGLRTTGVMPEDVCFHAQQCAEKALKGLLTSLTIQHPRTHALEVLLDLLKANDIQVPANVDEAFELTQYAVQTCYPGEWEPVTTVEARHALERAALVLAWVESNITVRKN